MTWFETMIIRTRVEDWSKTVIGIDSSFQETLELITKIGYQVALVCTPEGRLLGVVTDGDIRRALLKGLSLDKNVSAVMNSSPLIVNEGLGEKEANEIMNINHLFHLPVVSESGQLSGLHVADHLFIKRKFDEALVIMAGGKGKRLMPLTAKTPKPMLLLDGKPILEHVIDKAKISGFNKIFISVNYLADRITEYFEDGSRFGVEIRYIHEDSPLGTAGALKFLPPEVKEQKIVVTNSDVLTDVCYGDLLTFSKNTSSDGLMAVRSQEWTNPFGVVKTEGNKLIGIEEKPTHRYQVNAGVYIVSEKMLRLTSEGEYCDMTELFERGIKSGLDINVYALHESWIDIGNPSDYEKAISSLHIST